MQHQFNIPKPLAIGAGVLVLLGLFLASGDPGKDERQQLMKAAADSQAKIAALEEKVTQQEGLLRQQTDAAQMATRRMEVAEEKLARVQTRMDDVERTVAALRAGKVAAPTAIKPAVKPVVKPAVKPATKPTITPIKR
jgi:uncharacterized coiled-coil protein SlyX